MSAGRALRILAVDDDEDALREIVALLGGHPLVGDVVGVPDATEAVRSLERREFDGAFLDVHLPGLDGIDLARLLARMAAPPVVVFVTACDRHAVEAFELDAADYVLKPVAGRRLDEAVRRVAAAVSDEEDDGPVTVPVERGGRILLVDRDRISYVEACGDYVRLHSEDGAFLVRVPMATLEARWRGAGFLRIHRRYLVALRHLTEIHSGPGGAFLARVAGVDLPVSRRHAHELREHLRRAAWHGGLRRAVGH